MQITQKQYEKIAKHLPKQRGNVSMSASTDKCDSVCHGKGRQRRPLPHTCGNEQMEQKQGGQPSICRLAKSGMP